MREAREFTRNHSIAGIRIEETGGSDDERPWYLSWEITWPTLVQPAARPS